MHLSYQKSGQGHRQKLSKTESIIRSRIIDAGDERADKLELYTIPSQTAGENKVQGVTPLPTDRDTEVGSALGVKGFTGEIQLSNDTVAPLIHKSNVNGAGTRFMQRD